MSECEYTPSHVANFFLVAADKEDTAISPLKLLKLVYIGYGWVAALLDKPLFDEEIEAWQHGPVVESLYHEFKHFGKHPITDLATCFDLDSFDLTTPQIPKNDSDVIETLTIVWDVYKRFSGWDLRNKTHEKGSPWSRVYRRGLRGEPIPYAMIKEYFEQRIGAYLEEANRR